jgi:hypothetical protein
MLVPIISIGFVAIESVMIVIVLVALVIMLLMRYIYIAVLAILMPFAWLCWVFPKLNNHWSKWWSEFIRWTLFAPICIFFLYLSIATMKAMSNAGAASSQSFAAYTSASNPAWGGISSLVTSVFTPIFGSALNMIVMLGLSVAGLIVANSMGIKGADIGMKAVGGVQKGITNYANKAGQKSARATYQKMGGSKITKSLQEGRIGTTLKKIPVLGKVIPGGLIRRGESLAGRAISGMSSNEALVEAAKKNVPKSPDEIRTNLRGSMSKEDQMAHIASLVASGDLREKDKDGNDEMVNGKTMREFLNENLDKDSDVAKRFGQVKMGADANVAVGGDKEVRIAEDQLKALQTSGTANTVALTAATNKLDGAVKEFIGKLKKGDAAKINANEVFRHDTALSRTLLKQFALTAPQLVTGMLPKMKAENLVKLDITYRDVIKNAYAVGTPDEKKHLVGDGPTNSPDDPSKDSVLGRYIRAFGNNATGFSGTGGGGGATGGGGGGGANP